MTTILDKQLKRVVTVNGIDYTVAIDADGFRLTAKGKRRPQVELLWRDLLSGEAAMAVALNASLSEKRQSTNRGAAEYSADAGKMRRTKASKG